MNPKEKNTYVKKQVTKALVSLLNKKKISEISVSEICDKAHVGRASFYRNFNSKEEIIQRHTEMLINNWAEGVDNDPTANIYTFFQSLFQHFKDNQLFYKVLYKHNMSTMILRVIRERLELNTATNPKKLYARAFAAYGIFGLIDIWFSTGMKETPDELNKIILNSLNNIIIGAKAIDKL